MSNPFRLFVANIEWAVDDDQLFRFFNDYCDIKAAKIVRTPDGNSRGFAFIDLRSQDAVDTALELDGASLGSRIIKVERCRER